MYVTLAKPKKTRVPASGPTSLFGQGVRPVAGLVYVVLSHQPLGSFEVADYLIGVKSRHHARFFLTTHLRVDG